MVTFKDGVTYSSWILEDSELRFYLGAYYPEAWTLKIDSQEFKEF